MNDNINNITNSAVDEASKQLKGLLIEAIKDITKGTGGAVERGVSYTLTSEEKQARGAAAAAKAPVKRHANMAASVRGESSSPRTLGVDEKKIYQLIDIENIYDASNPNSKEGNRAVTYARSVYDKEKQQFGNTEYFYVSYDDEEKITDAIGETAEVLFKMITDIDGQGGDGASAQSIRNELMGGLTQEEVKAIDPKEVKKYLQKVIKTAHESAKKGQVTPVIEGQLGGASG